VPRELRDPGHVAAGDLPDRVARHPGESELNDQEILQGVHYRIVLSVCPSCIRQFDLLTTAVSALDLDGSFEYLSM